MNKNDLILDYKKRCLLARDTMLSARGDRISYWMGIQETYQKVIRDLETKM